MVQKQDVEHTLRFVVTAKNAEATMSATSVATALVKAAATAEPVNTSPPMISGTVQENQTLTADKGAWSGGEPIAYGYAWQRGDSGGGHFATIAGATKTTYTLTKSDVDHSFRVTVTAKNSDGSSSASSAATAAVKAVTVTPAQSTTLSASTSNVVYGTGSTLSGTISSKQSGQRVTVLAQRYEDAKFSSLANVTTGSGGTWSYLAKPTIQTAYQIQWNKTVSSSLKIGVHPLVTFRAITGNRFTTRVAAARSFAGKIVQLQRRTPAGHWVTLKRLHLNTNSTVVFPTKLLPKGNSTVRIALASTKQAPATSAASAAPSSTTATNPNPRTPNRGPAAVRGDISNQRARRRHGGDEEATHMAYHQGIGNGTARNWSTATGRGSASSRTSTSTSRPTPMSAPSRRA